MPFLKFDSDATGFEKFITWFAVLFCALWVLFFYCSIWGIFNNAFTATANKASAGQHTLGFIFFIAFLLSLVGIFFDKLPFKTSGMGKVGLVALTLLLSLSFYSGFWGVV